MGVPTLGCTCRVCTSSDPRDQRLRPSVAIEWQQDAPEATSHRVVIDTGPDFRQQALRFGIHNIDAVFYTHAHADHILGLDDLRPLSFSHRDHKMPLYADAPTAEVLERVFSYTFSANATYPTRARVELRRLDGPVDIAGVTFTPVPLLHGHLEVTGYRFGNAAYLTDMSSVPETSLALLNGIEVAVLDALRPQPHPSHANIADATAWAHKIGARSSWFTHMSHEVMHAETDGQLPPSIRLAYDGLRIPIEL
ncbi:MAG TPA: MBL fold metallo-hydrolase [Acidobacteriaceae bacterium]|jgi:phosphoribosyl 1,2-cyclic phosphate phosphodiesterase